MTAAATALRCCDDDIGLQAFTLPCQQLSVLDELMRLIVNADDFGYDDDTVVATISALEAGTLSSATIMANMPATMSALRYAGTREQISFGVHLTYVCDTVEAPVSRPDDVPGLVGEDRRFHSMNTVLRLVLQRRIKISEIIRETDAQLARVRDHGVHISHVDSHGHLHKLRPFREALKAVLPRFNIRRVRTAQNIYLRRRWSAPTYWFGTVWGAALSRHFQTTDYFFMSDGTLDENWPDALMARSQSGVLEVGVHPGFREEWRRVEAGALVQLAALMRARGDELIGWHQL